MRNKKLFSFDEGKDAEEVNLNGFPNGVIDYNKMYLIAKYFRHTFGYGEIRLERELIRFCKGQDKNFNPITDADLIKKWIKSAMMYDLRKIESVTVSQKEIDFLKTIEIPKDRKLLFVTLVLSKALKGGSTRKKKKGYTSSGDYYIRYNNFLDIIHLAGIKGVTEVDFAKLLNKYKQYVTFYNPEKELVRLDFADKHPETKIVIENMDKIMEYYELFFGKPKSVCALCGKEIVKNSNRQRTCPDCSLVLEKERKARWRNKKRDV